MLRYIVKAIVLKKPERLVIETRGEHVKNSHEFLPFHKYLCVILFLLFSQYTPFYLGSNLMKKLQDNVVHIILRHNTKMKIR